MDGKNQQWKHEQSSTLAFFQNFYHQGENCSPKLINLSQVLAQLSFIVHFHFSKYPRFLSPALLTSRPTFGPLAKLGKNTWIVLIWWKKCFELRCSPSLKPCPLQSHLIFWHGWTAVESEWFLRTVWQIGILTTNSNSDVKLACDSKPLTKGQMSANVSSGNHTSNFNNQWTWLARILCTNPYLSKTSS